jgi:hypothetical protein
LMRALNYLQMPLNREMGARSFCGRMRLQHFTAALRLGEAFSAGMAG